MSKILLAISYDSPELWPKPQKRKWSKIIHLIPKRQKPYESNNHYIGKVIRELEKIKEPFTHIFIETGNIVYTLEAMKLFHFKSFVQPVTTSDSVNDLIDVVLGRKEDSFKYWRTI